MNNDVFYVFVDEHSSKIINQIDNGSTIFQEDSSVEPKQIPGKNKKIVPWGDDNLLPNQIIQLQRKDEVMTSNLLFNIFSGYGAGLHYTTEEGENVTDRKIIDFFKYNRPASYLLEQVTDMKHFFFSVAIIILNREGTQIVRLVHKDAMYCRFETKNKKGHIEHIFYSNWEKEGEEVEEIELLDTSNPLRDLMVRTGKLPNDEGLYESTKTRKFAILNKLPTPGNNYYPFPTHWSLFNSGWYDIKQMIPNAKKSKLKNGLMLRFQVIVDIKYWEHIFQTEAISDPVKKQARIKKEKNNIRDFLTGEVNAGKTWFTAKYTDPNGKEVDMITIKKLDDTKEGGDWIEDTEEASNMMCYAQGVHPSLIGATPGKTKGSFSGTDKRELFTMKQALEKAIRDILLEPFFVLKNFNGWGNVVFDIPFLLLTTLDEKKDAKMTTTNNNL